MDDLTSGKREYKMANEKHINEWVFIGDVNPVEHGGIWIRENGEDGDDFEFIKVQEWFDEHIALAHGHVDPTDSWIDREGVESYADHKLTDGTHMFVANVVDYYGIGEFDMNPDYIPVDVNTESKVRAYLKGQGITF